MRSDVLAVVLGTVGTLCFDQNPCTVIDPVLESAYRVGRKGRQRWRSVALVVRIRLRFRRTSVLTTDPKRCAQSPASTVRIVARYLSQKSWAEQRLSIVHWTRI